MELRFEEFTESNPFSGFVPLRNRSSVIFTFGGELAVTRGNCSLEAWNWRQWGGGDWRRAENGAVAVTAATVHWGGDSSYKLRPKDGEKSQIGIILINNQLNNQLYCSWFKTH